MKTSKAPLTATAVIAIAIVIALCLVAALSIMKAKRTKMTLDSSPVKVSIESSSE